MVFLTVGVAIGATLITLFAVKNYLDLGEVNYDFELEEDDLP